MIAITFTLHSFVTLTGNMSANNGCMIVYDEMTKDLTPAEVDERIEFWKRMHCN